MTDDFEFAFRGCEINERTERERRAREERVRRMTCALTESAVALHGLSKRLGQRPFSADPDVSALVVACNAVQLTVETVLRGMVFERDYGMSGMLKYPGLREWFAEADAEETQPTTDQGGSDHG